MHLQLCILLISSGIVNCYQTYQAKIPNGDNVPHPCDPSGKWEGVGHYLQSGGGNRNPFGSDFATTNFEWNKCLCEHDSDGDGKTNGEELGDPNCVWTEGDIPEFTTDLTHPGLCEPTADPKCLQMNQEFGEICEPTVFECDAAAAQGTQQVDIRFQSTPIPTEETTYMCVSDTLPSDDEYHLVAYEPLIDNVNVVHHILVYGCDDDVEQSLIDNYAEPKSCDMGLRGCQNLIGLWGYGHPGECFPDHFGFNIGVNGFTKVIMQVHYNNPLGMEDQMDTSGLRFYYTADKRVYDAAVLTTGVLTYFTLPPKMPAYSHYGGCGPTCTSKWAHNITLWSVGFHMHYLGLSTRLDIYRGDTKISELVLSKYNYDSPETTPYETPVVVQPGDRLKLTCTFDTTSKSSYTYYGDATSDEMCFAFISYYPALDLDETFCLGYRDFDSCDMYTSDDKLQYGACSDVQAYWESDEYVALSEQVLSDCNTDTCTSECQAIVDEMADNPCGDPELLLMLSEFLIASKDISGVIFAERLAPCINSQAGDASDGSSDADKSTNDVDCPLNNGSGSVNAAQMVIAIGVFVITLIKIGQ